MVSTHKYTIVLVLIGWNALVVVAGSSLLSQPEIEPQLDTMPVQFVATTTDRTLQEADLKGPDLFSDGPLLNMVKRAPMGFQGMRGKKNHEDNDIPLDNSYLLPNEVARGLLYNNHLQIPINKWAALSDPSSLYRTDKRAPNGFLGMRGKKDTLLDEMQYLMSLRDAEERLQNERRLLGEFARQYQQFEQTPIDIGGGAPIKRAPSSGFFGMRGKKFDDEQQESSSWDDDGAHQKRAGGFVGMRGKKWSDGDGYQRDEDGYDAADEGMVKRAPSLGFHGMRGKKDVNDVMQFEKRAPPSGFFGMRGKKVPSGFFGTRGKKGPFELRHKFVGVRGKKVPGGVPAVPTNAISGYRQLRTGNEYLMPEMQSAHLSDASFGANKRVPTGFLGMRGKKWSGSTLD